MGKNNGKDIKFQTGTRMPTNTGRLSEGSRRQLTAHMWLKHTRRQPYATHVCTNRIGDFIRSTMRHVCSTDHAHLTSTHKARQRKAHNLTCAASNGNSMRGRPFGIEARTTCGRAREDKFHIPPTFHMNACT